MNGRISRSDLVSLLVLFFLGFALRLLRLFDFDVWFDEVVLLFQLDKSFQDIWNVCKMDNFPPLFPWLLKLWHSIFPGEHSLRLFSALLGSLTPPAAYLLGKELLNKKLAWLLGIACCISVPFLYYSQMIRMYSLFPFFACLSFIGFIRGLRTNQWKYWILVAVANLLGFYTFVFMLFLIAVEFLIVIWVYRSRIRSVFRPIVTHVPAVFIILLWIIPLLSRYSQLQESFWLGPFSEADMVILWFFLGTGSDFNDRYIIAVLLNLPFLFGILIGIRVWLKNDALKVAAGLFFGTILVVFILSNFGQSLFFKRYFLFLLPLYLGMVLTGWMQLRVIFWRRLGLCMTFCSLLVSMIYYYAYYGEFHIGYLNSSKPYSEFDMNEGHAVSKVGDLIAKNLQVDEVIVHYSHPELRSFTFFPSLYYHDRSLPEYIYSVNEIPQYYGQQYLEPGERIRELADLNPLPMGIWMVSLDSAEAFFDIDVQNGWLRGWIWVKRENFIGELQEKCFFHEKTTRFGAVSALHFRRESRINATIQQGHSNSEP